MTITLTKKEADDFLIRALRQSYGRFIPEGDLEIQRKYDGDVLIEIKAEPSLGAPLPPGDE